MNSRAKKKHSGLSFLLVHDPPAAKFSWCGIFLFFRSNKNSIPSPPKQMLFSGSDPLTIFAHGSGSWSILANGTYLNMTR